MWRRPGSLATKVNAVLEQIHPAEQTHPGDVDVVVDVTAREAERLGPELGAPTHAVREHLSLLSRSYTAAVSPRAVVRHTLMASSRPGPTDVRTRVTPGDRTVVGDALAEVDGDGVVAEVSNVDELDVVALDHPGWFAKVAGVVALHGGSILAADAFCRDDGLAVDTFKVRSPQGSSGSWWARVEGDLADAAAGRLAVRARVLDKARQDAARVAKLPPVPTSVTFDDDPSGRSTVIEVRTLDRIGVLYAIAAALSELELEIVVARIQTIGHEVVDVFFARDGEGGPLDADHRAEVELGITAALAEL